MPTYCLVHRNSVEVSVCYHHLITEQTGDFRRRLLKGRRTLNVGLIDPVN